MNNNLEFENENPESYEDGPRSNYGAGYGSDTEKTEQENLKFKKVDCNYCGRLNPDTMCKLHPASCQNN